MQSKDVVRAALAGAVVACFLAGSGPASAAGQTAMQRAIGQCMATVGLSAVAGALIGGMAGNHAGRGAAIGAATAVGSCAVLMQIAAAEDQRRIAEAERQAVLANASRSDSFRTQSGKPAKVTTQVRPVAAPAAVARKPQAPSECRESAQTVSVDGASTATKQVWCRYGDEWAPVDI